ncbi:scaffold protein [Paenibacillus dendritiformis]|uniref:phage scaffolding protein n=1 Tax=Paenibacillus dendritiformis TaxID=130049 RepID=UPI001B024AE4|nr:phage scaffolding protein [Paenibacillus dendritiformis]GIO71334.1 scaffold protein [Paenibacillus dendritiformis]
MNKEQLLALGLSDEQAEKAAAASQEELKAYIPKTRFDEVNAAKKKAEDDLKERDKQLEELSKAAGTSEELKKQIEKLQAENQAAKEQYEADLKDLTLTNAIKSALAGKVHDEALVAGLFDKSKLVIDGDEVVGLEEQLKGLQESKSFLFKTDGSQQQQQPGFKVGGNGEGNPPSNKPASLADAIASHFKQ